MRKIYAIVFAAILGCITVFAIPARRGFIKFTQPDGSVIMLQRHGDEFSNWVTDASGRVMQSCKHHRQPIHLAPSASPAFSQLLQVRDLNSP